MRIKILAFTFLIYALFGFPEKGQSDTVYQDFESGMSALAQAIQDGIENHASPDSKLVVGKLLNQTNGEKWIIGNRIENFLVTQLAKSSLFELLERRGQETLLKESGDEISGYRIKNINADIVLLGSYRLLDEILNIQLRAALVSEQRVLTSAETKIEVDSFKNELRSINQQTEIWPFARRFAQMLPNSGFFLTPAAARKQNPYLKQTPLIQEINQHLNGNTLDLQLTRANYNWHLSFQEAILQIPPEEFERLYVTVLGTKLQLKISNPNLKEGDSFYLRLYSENSGYVHLLNVYETGQVAVIKANEKVHPKDWQQIPHPDEANELVAGLLEENKPTHDLYVALWTPGKIDINRFMPAGSQSIDSEAEFKFGELLVLLRDYHFATVLVRTMPR